MIYSWFLLSLLCSVFFVLGFFVARFFYGQHNNSVSGDPPACGGSDL